jgi:signal transduction histidine kinase
MVIQLTDLARLQAGRLSMKMTELHLNDIAQAIQQRLSVVADEKDITLHLDTRPLPAVTGDGDRLAQVMTNLVSNAIKYTDPGGDVWITTRCPDAGVELSVRDNGIGIPPDELSRVFERFYQVDKARGPARGTGLGLAITQEIIEAHGGTIHVDSPGTDQGTTFTIRLPAAGATTLISNRS